MMDASSNLPDPDGVDSTAPSEPGSTLLPIPSGLPSRPFSRFGNFLWTLAFFLSLGFLLWATYGHREESLADPERYLERVLGRDLDAAEAFPKLPGWQRALNLWDASNLADSLRDSIATYEMFFKDKLLLGTENAPRALAIMLAESGQPQVGEERLAQRADEASLAEFKPIYEMAYLKRKPNRTRASFDPILAEITPAWARDKLTLRLERALGDVASSTRRQNLIDLRGRALQIRISQLDLINLFATGTGLGVLGWCLWQRRFVRPVAMGQPVGQWTFADGYGVLVRGAVAGFGVAGLLTWLSQTVPFLNGLTTLISGLPVLWLAERHLLTPAGLTFRSCFGLSIPLSKWSGLFAITLAVLSLMILGEAGLSALTTHWQNSSLVESVPEEFLFDPWRNVLFSSIDAIIWAPLIEETAFRGLLYTSLRRRLPIFWSATLSSLVFGAVHGYSLPGFLIIVWSGFLWALAFEKSKSLWPGILCHAISNLLAVLSPVLLYRI